MSDLNRLVNQLRDLAGDLDYLADDLGGLDEADHVDGESEDLILSLLKVLPHVIDHAEGYTILTDRDVRILRDSLVGLQDMAKRYHIKEQVKAVAA